MFDTSCFNEFYNFIKVNGNYTPFALTLNYEEEDVTMNVYAYNYRQFTQGSRLKFNKCFR